MSNFKFLQSDPAFASFMDVAMAAEKILHIDPAASILNCRRAMEFAVKWMYSVDKELEMPYQDNLQSLMTREEFRTIVGHDIWRRMDYIRLKGNHAAHDTGKVSEAAAMLCLENLHKCLCRRLMPCFLVFHRSQNRLINSFNTPYYNHTYQ